MFKKLIGIMAGVSLLGAPVLVGCEDRGGAGKAGQEQPYRDDGMGGAGDIDRDRTWEQEELPELPEFEPGPDEGLDEGTGGAGEVIEERDMEAEDREDRDFGIDTGIDATDVPGGGGSGSEARDEYRD